MNFPKTVSKFYWGIVLQNRLFFGSMFILSFGVVVIEYVWSPFINKLAVSLFEKAAVSNFSGIIKTLTLIAILFISEFLIKMALSIIEGHKKETIRGDVRGELYKRVYANDASFFLNRQAGQISNKIDEVQKNFYGLTLDFWTGTAGIIVGFIVISGTLFSMNTWLAVVITSFGIMRTIWQLYFQKTTNKLGRKIVDAASVLSGARADTLVNAITVKLFAGVNYESEYIKNKQDYVVKLRERSAFIQRLRWAPMDFGWLIIRFLQIVFCWYLIRAGKLSISDAVFALSAFLSINAMFTKFNILIQDFSENKAKSEHAFEDLLQEQTVIDIPNAKKLKVSKGEIIFDNVSFDYGEEKIIKDFSLKIRGGEKIGLVGFSGAGKTTLIKLILRLYDVNSGSIKIDDQDIRNIRQNSLRREISFVPQDSDLFNRTLMENIRYAAPDASDAEIIAAAKKANIHEFIDSLPKKYETWVGSRGIKLSGGQRARIAIARAIIKDTGILILDEATSALDSKNEKLVHDALNEIMKNKTVIAIAHRFSTLRNMDRIIVMNKGRIAEMGTHTQLLRLNGIYKKLWELQTGGFIR